MAASWQRIVQLAPVSCMASSPLLRCREFAVQQALASRVPLHVAPALAECHFGTWENRPLADISATTPDWQTLLARGLLTPEGGESFDTFRTRVLTGFTEWMQQARGSHRVLVSHGGVINVLLAELLGTEFNVARLMAVQRGGLCPAVDPGWPPGLPDAAGIATASGLAHKQRTGYPRAAHRLPTILSTAYCPCAPSFWRSSFLPACPRRS